MGEPRLHPIRNTLTATTVAGVMLVTIADCAGSPLNAKESDASAGGSRDPEAEHVRVWLS